MDIILLCKICSKSCTKCYETILCNICKKWLHFKCSNLTRSQFTELSTGSVPYYCYLCIYVCLPVDLVQISKPHDTNKIPCNPIDELVHTDFDDLPNPSVVSLCQYHDTASFNSLSATLLDDIYTNNIKMPVQPRIILSDLSDHLPTFVLIKSSCLKQKHSSITLRHNYKNLDRSTFLQEIKDALDMLPVNNGNPCQVVDDIHSIFNDTMQKHTPLQPLSRNRMKLLNKPWITQALYKCIKEKKEIYRSLVKSGFENKVKFAYYKRYRNQLAHLLVLSKKEYYKSQFLIARNDSANDSAKTWKLINTLLPGRTKATSTPPNLTHPLSGECKQNPADIANIL